MNDLKERLKEFLRIKNYSQHTISNYERDINRFLIFLEEKKADPYGIMNPGKTRGWIMDMAKE